MNEEEEILSARMTATAFYINAAVQCIHYDFCGCLCVYYNFTTKYLMYSYCVYIILLIHKVLQINLKHFFFYKSLWTFDFKVKWLRCSDIEWFFLFEKAEKVNKSQFICKLTWFSSSNVFVIIFCIRKTKLLMNI